MVHSLGFNTRMERSTPSLTHLCVRSDVSGCPLRETEYARWLPNPPAPLVAWLAGTSTDSEHSSRSCRVLRRALGPTGCCPPSRHGESPRKELLRPPHAR